MRINIKPFLIALLISGIFLSVSFIFTGCQSMGFNRGVKDYETTHIKGKSALTWGYAYGYMRGWEYRKLQHAREIRESKRRNRLRNLP